MKSLTRSPVNEPKDCCYRGQVLGGLIPQALGEVCPAPSPLATLLLQHLTTDHGGGAGDDEEEEDDDDLFVVDALDVNEGRFHAGD